MSTLNIGFYVDLTKIIFELSSNTHLISSAAIATRELGHILLHLPNFRIPKSGTGKDYNTTVVSGYPRFGTGKDNNINVISG